MVKYMIYNKTSSALMYGTRTIEAKSSIYVSDISDPWFSHYKNLGVINISSVNDNKSSNK